jgi:hypothetical protein
MSLSVMRQLLEDEALAGAATADNDLAFVDWQVPDRLLYSPIVSRNLTQPLAWHLAAAGQNMYPVWTLEDIMRVSTAEEVAEAEAFAREHYGPAPPPGQTPQRPARRQRRGCRGGKGRKRHVVVPRGGVLLSPRISSNPAYMPMPWASVTAAGSPGLLHAPPTSTIEHTRSLFHPALGR